MPPIQILDAAQQFQLLSAITHGLGAPIPPRHAPRNLCLTLLMLDAGLRVGETVKLSRPTLVVAAGPTQTLFLGPDITKTHLPRSIPTTIRLVQAIQNHLDLNFPGHLHFPTDWAFSTTRFASHITIRQVQHIIHDASLRGLNFPVTCHSLRHTFATRIMRTASIRIVQDLLGHKRLSSTQIYTHPNCADLRQAIDALDRHTPMNLDNSKPPPALPGPYFHPPHPGPTPDEESPQPHA